MKVPFTQNTKSGCGSYCLANLFNDESFIKGVENLEFGEGVAILNKKLQQLEPAIYLECVYASPSEMVLQSNKLVDPLVFQMIWHKVSAEHKNNFARPFLISVKMISGRFHAILVLHDLKTDLYYLVDSLVSEIQAMGLNQLMQFYQIHSVEYFCSWEISAEDQSILINKSVLNHLIKC